jgi:hypothetical protein
VQDQVLDIMRLDVGSALCEASFAALEDWLEEAPRSVDTDVRVARPAPA